MRALISLVLLVFAAAAQEPVIDPVKTTIVVTAKPVEPAVDRRNSEVFERTLFSRDDQIFHVLDAGINAGQHEGGGKSLEIRRFGFNLDHGGVNGGLKVLVDDVQQNQGTQGHGQGYLGSLKSLSPELVQDVETVNGPFRAEYGDFSGLGVVHIRTRETMPDVWTVRMQGGSFGSERGFFSFSPSWKKGDSIFAYEGSHTDGPFQNPLRYTRHNVTGGVTQRLDERHSIGFKYNVGLNDFYSSGQIPIGLVDRFAFIDPTGGGRARSGTGGVYYRQEDSGGGVLKVDGFVTRSMFDLYSNFTFFLTDTIQGDAIQQHDSRLIEGANAQYERPHKIAGLQALLTAGGNFHDNQINVGLYPREGRVPTGVTTRDHAVVLNGAGYAQESVTLLGGRMVAGAGLRVDEFRFDIAGRNAIAVTVAQPKANVSFRPTLSLPFTLYANYGRGISTADARGVVRHREEPAVSTTDFYQLGSTQQFGRISTTVDAFWIDRSNEQVYIPDDGTFEFKRPSRSYGFEAKASVELNHHLSLNGGLTKVANSFYRRAIPAGTGPRVYVDSAPHFTANAGLTLAGWHGWSGSLRMRAINHYRLDGEDASIVASGHTVFDLGVSRRLRRGVEFNLALDNLTNRDYWETQNYFESRLPGQLAASRIHGTPGYPLTATIGITVRLKGK